MTLEGILHIYISVSVEDDDLYRYKDARVTTNFDRTKYNYDKYFFGQHYYAVINNGKALRDHPDDPRVKLLFILDELETPEQYSMGRKISKILWILKKYETHLINNLKYQNNKI